MEVPAIRVVAQRHGAVAARAVFNGHVPVGRQLFQLGHVVGDAPGRDARALDRRVGEPVAQVIDLGDQWFGAAYMLV